MITTPTNNRRKNILPKGQINHEKKPELNKTFLIQIDAIRSVNDDDIEKVESGGLFAELDGLEWLERQIAVYILQEKLRRSSAKFIAAVYATRS